MIPTGKNNFANYREMSKPFPSNADAETAIQSFYDAVEKARNEFHIADVHVITQVSISRDSREGMAMSSAHFGDSLQGALMCAWSLGQEEANYKTAIGEYLKP
jgi:hypothetical protein